MNIEKLIDLKGLPHSEHTEKVILGAMMSDLQAAMDARMMIRPHYFLLPSNRLIFSACIAVMGRGEDVQSITVCSELESRRQLLEVGGRTYVMSLCEGLPYSLVVENYAGILREKAKLRSLISAAHVAAKEGLEDGAKAEFIRGYLNAAIADVDADDGMSLHSADEVMDEVFRAIDPEQPEPISTGIQGLDAQTAGGIRRGELWIAGGLPGRGKSSLARQFGMHAAKHGTPTLIHSIEMPRWQWLMLDTATEAQVPAWKLRQPGLISATTRKYLHNAAVEVRQMPLFFEESPDLDKILAKTRVAVVRERVELVVVDYAQRVRTNDTDPRQRLARVTLALADLAKEEDVAIVLLSQLTPSQGGSLNTRPTMQNLRESRDMEAHAHAVLLNYMPVDLETGSFTGEDEIIIGKQRFGAIGTVPVRYDTQFLRFHDREK
jgi:replicative DNA helicase